MKLIGSLTSPYVRKARIVLAEKHVGYTFELDVPWNDDSQVSDYNPLGKVPVLIMDDGTSVFDSRVIVEYLDSVNPVSRLIPDGNRRRIAVKRWEALADGICGAAAAIFLAPRRGKAQQSGQWISRQQKKVEGGLEAAARELGDRKWCEGNGPSNAYSLADIAVGCALGYLAFRFPEIKWRENFPNLADLSDRLEKRPAFMETAPRD